MGGDKKVRRVLPASSVKEASLWQRAMTSAARLVVSVVRTKFQIHRRMPHKGSGLAYELRCDPAQKNEANKDFPTVSIPVGCDGKVIADHNKDNGNRQEGVVFGAQLGLRAE